MESDRYDPPEAKVADLIARFTPRQLAIAYLRAQHRFRQSDQAFRVLADLDSGLGKLRSGDEVGALDDVQRAARRFAPGGPYG